MAQSQARLEIPNELETMRGVAARLSVLGQPAYVSEFIPRPSACDGPICLHYVLDRNDCIHIGVNNVYKMVLFVEEIRF